jgi:pantoate--beta-alanine ligase
VQVIDSAAGLTKAFEADRAAGRTVGLVPTMGYLHEGHASLMRRAAADCDVVAASVFVNPLQFGPGEDLASYPRDLDHDIGVASRSGVQYLFAPPDEEMYPGPMLTTVRVQGVSEGMEGDSRPGHFSGVATVVAKLFALAGACRAYFGEKDYQQLVVIRRMARDLSFPVDVIGCPTVREADGLALSSRNVYLSAEERDAAPALHRALRAGRAAVEAGERRPSAVVSAMEDEVGAEPLARLDYAAAVDPVDLHVPEALQGDVRLLVAARIGATRLIDNLGARAPARPARDGTRDRS